MRRNLAVIALMLISLDVLSQNDFSITSASERINAPLEVYTGIITGQIKTTDGQPAASVTVYIKENGKFTTTDEQGRFSIKNLKNGVYTLEVTMVGLKSQQKTCTFCCKRPQIYSQTASNRMAPQNFALQ